MWASQRASLLVNSAHFSSMPCESHRSLFITQTQKAHTGKPAAVIKKKGHFHSSSLFCLYDGFQRSLQLIDLKGHDYELIQKRINFLYEQIYLLRWRTVAEDITRRVKWNNGCPVCYFLTELCCLRYSAAFSSALPPISPIRMMPSVFGSRRNTSRQSMKFVPLNGSPPIPGRRQSKPLL